MIKNGHKTSLLIPSQLPEFIRDNPDYEKFIAFIQAYYEWMEQTGNPTDRSKNILNYADIDRTTDEFLNYYINDFLPNFPSDALIDKKLAVKVAKQLYETKGTPASYQFLFRVLYDSDFDVFYTKDAVLRASDGDWFVPKSVRLATTDKRFLNIKNLRLFGEKSGTIATIENSFVSGNKIEVFLSDIRRSFESGETVRVVDSSNQALFFDKKGNLVPREIAINSIKVSMDKTTGVRFDETSVTFDNNNESVATVLRAKIVGQISQIKIDPKFRGLFYSTGDPVIVYKGVSDEITSPVEAKAEVGETTKGAIQRIEVISGGFGYRENPNTRIVIRNIQGAIARVGSINPDAKKTSNVIVALDSIDNKKNLTIGNTRYNFANGYIFVLSANNINPSTFTVGETVYQGTSVSSFSFKSTVKSFDSSSNTIYLNTSTGSPTNGQPIIGVSSGAYRTIDVLYSANSNTTLANAFSYINFLTYPLSTIVVDNGGGGATAKPEIVADSIYSTDAPVIGDGEYGIAHLDKLGILGPIQIANTGKGYLVNDTIVFSGGSGYGAFANVTEVSVDGSINAISYVSGTYLSSDNNYPLGGLGYRNDSLPTLTVNSANAQASGATLAVPCILGTSSVLDPTTDRIGSITTINVTDFGEDYSSKPSVSIRVEDVLVSNLTISTPPVKNDVAYQGSNVNAATFIASVDSYKLLVPYDNPTQTQYNLRLFNYNGIIDTNQVIKIENKNIALIPANTSLTGTNYNQNGIKIYGDGTARGTASFLNGLTLGEGQYISTRSLLSSYDILQDETYNNFTYINSTKRNCEIQRDSIKSIASIRIESSWSLCNKSKF